jgi:hypothetical protein
VATLTAPQANDANVRQRTDGRSHML